MLAEQTADPSARAIPLDNPRVILIANRLALGAILLTAAFLNIWKLNDEGYGNTYYAAAVKSMLQSWHNFFFVSFDPGGFVTVDKPPLGFWIQTASAKIFGFSGMSILLSEAIAGVLAVALLYHLVSRTYGSIAGLIAGLVLALSPISVVAARNNTIDSLLVLAVLLAAWATLRAAETGQLRWLLLGALLVGLGFNIKMLQAYLVVPALGAVYLFGSPVRWRDRLLHLLAAAAVLLVVSFSWIAAVDGTPASDRPYVGSSATNSELNLALGYNGLGRLTGNVFRQRNTARFSTGNNAPPGGFTRGETGASGPLRLLNTQLGGQIGWLLVLAILSFVAVALQAVPRLPLNREQQSAVLWGMWLLTMGVFFSVAGFFHTYYLTMVAPSIAALVGIGAAVMWRDFRSKSWRGWLLPIALVVTAFVQAHILTDYPDWSRWLTPLVEGGCLLAAALLVVSSMNLDWPAARLSAIGAAFGLLVLLAPPAAWAADSAYNANAGGLPSAGPSARSGNGGFQAFGGGRFPGFRPGGERPPGFGSGGGAPPGFAGGRPPASFRGGFRGFGGRDDGAVNTKLLAYLEAHQGATKFLLAVPNANSASPYILRTGKPVMALGGFIGDDKILTTTQLSQLIRNNTVRYFLLSGFGGFRGPGGGGNADLTTWVQNTCKAVPTSAWQGPSITGFGGGGSLYDCAGK